MSKVTDTLLPWVLIYPVLGIKAHPKSHYWGKVGNSLCFGTHFIPIAWEIHNNISFLDTILGIQNPLNTHFMGKYTISL